MQNELMIKLNKKFQGEIFQKLIIKYHGSIRASKILKIPASSIRGYKNLYSHVVPERLLKKLIRLDILNEKRLNENTLQIFNKTDIIAKNLDIGRQKRDNYFKRLRSSIPSLKKIIIGDYLDVTKWFNEYQHLVNSNFRKLDITEEENYLLLNYPNFTRQGYKNFEVKLPKKIKINDELIYFLGLWCGDRAGGKRFGICNQNQEVLDFTENFLRKYNQNIERIIYITKGIQEPNINYDKKFEINKEGSGWVLSIHSNNGIFTSFFYYLQSYLSEFLNRVKDKYPFFAGLFDAEGNVSLYNKSLRWACKNDNLIKIYSQNLKKLNLFNRYDGNCLISYNINEFYDKILPYMKHKDKINLINFLCKGEGDLPKDFLVILKMLRITPNSTSKEIAKGLKKNKVYSELRMLKTFQYVESEGYPNKFKLTDKGIKSIGV